MTTLDSAISALNNHTGVGAWAAIRSALPNAEQPVLVILGGLTLTKTAPKRLEAPGPGNALL